MPRAAEESQVVALILRAALENPDHRRIALITPDRRLALQVAIELKRWHINSSDDWLANSCIKPSSVNICG